VAGSYGEGKSFPEDVLFDFSHPWHSVPAQIVFQPVLIGGLVACSPLILIEWAVTGDFPLQETRQGIVPTGIGYLSLGLGFLAGLPFYALLLPLERSEPAPEETGGDRVGGVH